MRNHPVRYWVPRVLGILYAGFISLFTFDAWEGTSSFWEGLVGWLIHLLPVAIVILALIIAWRRPVVGGGIFLVLATIFLLLFANELDGDWTDTVVSMLVIAGPLALIGVLFMVEGRKVPPSASLQG